ncbi:hypothetical protein [Flavonifractor hominis]|uniref:DUF1611 domain-containing protein n=1 Tax=Flavonifractor hominis TaxID=3133178 RepID=A0ABV1EQK6_9FIRM
MEQLLAPLVGDASPVTLIGLCKNAGKTTTMRRLMNELGEECLGLTSVGRDGECTDLVTGTEKPDLYLKAGDLFATARGMLSLCDATLEVVDLTDVMTPLGPVGVFRALSDGYVQLAGPSAAGQLPPLTQRFRELGAQRVLIDGAAGRKSLAGAGVEGVALLCTGASLDRNMELVVAETAHTCWLFARKRPENTRLCQALDALEARFALFTPEGEPAELPLDESGAPKWNKLPRQPMVVWAAGGITDPLLKTLARRGAPTTLVASDATHVLAGRAALELFLRSGGELAVRRELTIAAVAANPWSAYGWHFEADRFVHALQEALDLPVVNVKEE